MNTRNPTHEKGPASAATDPGHGYQPLEKTSMNEPTNTTPAAAPATVPHPAQEPFNEIEIAMAHLRMLRIALAADLQGIETVTSIDAEAIVSSILDTLAPIRTFLAENDFAGADMPMPFLECRRHWYARAGGKAVTA
jgi:hypothetical protein